MTGMNVQERLRDVYLGPEHSNEDIGALLHESSAKYEDFRSDAEGFVEAVVDRLVDGKIIGWFQGRMEFGPRALGARSILADPRNSQMRDRINESVKMREAFRPFAPAVLEDFASTYFALDHASPFMLEVCEVISTVEMPAVTHVDGSARVQTVNDDSNPRFAALLSEFGLRTGCPVLLNTSFNVRGEPIVCSPLDALLCFAHSKIDTIAIGDFILDRENLPLHWEMEARQRRLHHVRSDRRPDQLVYTLV
jgi:carbamoyltransferase